MMGLLVKDFRLMKINIKSIVLITIMAIGYNVFSPNSGVASTMTGMIGFIFINIAINSIAYDEADNGFCYLMTLPFGKKMYVLEKYIYTIVAAIFGGFVSLVVGVIFQDNIKNLVLTTVVIIGIFLIIACIMLPIYIKFGVEKGKNYIFVAYGIFIGAIYLLYNYAGKLIKNNSAISKIYTKLTLLDMKVIVIAFMCIILVIYLLSMLISINIMKKKEF